MSGSCQKTSDDEEQRLPVCVAALYHFARIDAPETLKEPLEDVCDTAGVRGTLLLAREGINGTIAGPQAGVERVIARLRAIPGFSDLEWKKSAAASMPFHRMKVRLKAEIVTMGQPDVDPAARVGRYVEPENWNAVIARDDVVVIDTRNRYEVDIGTFEGAVDPGTDSFREFPDWWDAHGAAFAGKTVAMFCTGGIRCEKTTSWLVGQGVEDVVHLKGGILKYLEEVPEQESRWKGECFVFDQRVAVGHGLAPGTHELCHACRRPLSRQALLSDHYERGVSCAVCIGEFTDEDRRRFRDRQKQVVLAEKRGEAHFGSGSKKR